MMTEPNEATPSTTPMAETAATNPTTTGAEEASAASSSNDTNHPSPSSTTTTTTKRKVIRRRRRRKDDNDEIPPLDPILLEKVVRESGLPLAYSFEISKTVTRIVRLRAAHVALQMPEGLLLYATVLADVLQRLSQALMATVVVAAQEEQSKDTATTTTTQQDNMIRQVCQQVSVLGDVTYGACCIDDLGAQALGADLLVHYGHSCLVPLQHTAIPCLYVFVEIQMDVEHMVNSLVATLQADDNKNNDHSPKISNLTLYLLGTIQFRHCFGHAQQLLRDQGYENVIIPQVKPLSPGEVLGCTSPKLNHHQNNNQQQEESENSTTRTCCLFVADGRFHLESTLISNPDIDVYYRYDPYGKTITTESYEHEEMKGIRWQAIQQASQALQQTTPATFGIILGTLGRQGNPAIVQRIKETLRKQQDGTCRSFVILLSEITPAKLALLDDKVQVWVQVACPRLSVDWGHFLSQNNKPVLSPYELFVATQETDWQQVYPMDFYAQSGGPWANYHEENKQRQVGF